jgi:hypothetical protein
MLTPHLAYKITRNVHVVTVTTKEAEQFAI